MESLPVTAVEPVRTSKLMLTPKEVSETLAISRGKAYELIASGTIPSVTFGRLVRVPEDALRSWTAEHLSGIHVRRDGRARTGRSRT